MSGARSLQGQVVLVTGASGALGEVVARSMRERGAQLVLPARNARRVRERFGPDAGADGAIVIEADLTDPMAVADVVRCSLQELGSIDALINVAGGFEGGTPVHETPLETWDRMFQLNLRTALLMSRSVIEPMAGKGRGCIVNVGSVAALSGSAGIAAYSASKSALLRLTESMSDELRSAGIRVNCVLPGTLDTAANRAAMPQADRSDWVSPAAVSDVIAFLVSDSARALNGVGIPVRAGI